MLIGTTVRWQPIAVVLIFTKKFRHLKKETRGGICYSFSIETNTYSWLLHRSVSQQKSRRGHVENHVKQNIYIQGRLYFFWLSPSVWEGWHWNSRREHRPGRTLTRAPSLRVADASYNSACQRFRAFRRCSDPDTASSLKHSYRRAKQKH